MILPRTYQEFVGQTMARVLFNNFCTQYKKNIKSPTFPKLKITSWNVNGLRSVINKKMLQPFIQSDNADILCMNETRIDSAAYTLTQIQKLTPSYHHYLNESKTKRGYSGVGVLTKILPINVYHDFSYIQHQDQTLSSEGRLLTLQFEKFFLLNVYKPNAGLELIRLNYRMKYDTIFNQYIDILNKKKPTIIVGDFNVAPQPIDLTNPSANKNNAGFTLQERQKFRQLLSRGMIDGFRSFYPNKIKYTWWSNRANSRANNIGWRIDHIVYHGSIKNVFQDIIIMDEVLGSDHCPIQAIMNLDKLSSC